MLKKLTLAGVFSSFFIAVSQIGLAVTLPVNPIFSLLLLVIAIAAHGLVLFWEHFTSNKHTEDEDKLEDLLKRVKTLEQAKNMERLTR